jgi:hypothetical protein
VQDLADRLKASQPFPRGARGDWDAVLADSKGGVTRRFGLPAGLMAALLAAVLVALFWPFGTGRSGGVLERALAAAGDGPVVHLVVREGWGGGILVDTVSGARERISLEREVWYDPARGLHETSRLGGQKIVDLLTGAVPSVTVRELKWLARDYRSALESGDTKLLGPDTLEGIPVYWIRIAVSRCAPFRGGCRLDDGEDIAISQDDYRPVGMRVPFHAGTPGPASRILDYETLPAGNGDFAAPPPSNTGVGMSYRFGPTGSVTRLEARRILPALWDGDRLGELPLAGIERLQWAERSTAQGTWARRIYGVRIAYGLGTPALPTLPRGKIDNSEGPYVVIDQFPSPPLSSEMALWTIGDYEPPEGQLFLQGKWGVLLTPRVAVTIMATSPELVVEAARGLGPMPPR